VTSSKSQWAVISIGGCDMAVREGVELLRQRGVDLDYMRLRGFPFHESVEKFVLEHELCFVVEQNRDAQLHSLLVLETGIPKDRLRSVLAYGGFPLSARNVVEGILNHAEVELETTCPR
jgi:2-oxoglutarate/2-oxoacid ferredoxin oxidoreductase subunit alpha